MLNLMRMDVDLPKKLMKFIANDYFIGAASLLLLLLFAKAFFRRHWISISSSKFGKIKVSCRALYAAICEVANGVGGVSVHRVKIATKHGKIYINVYVKLNVCCNVSVVSEDIQVCLSNSLVNDLGLNNVGKINVIIASFLRKGHGNGEIFAENYCKYRGSKTDSGADEIS
ncbi:MAG: hypothetical protein LBB15_01550 [Puniceicoccales bacterium]|jgi:hypothetical protein|nr:hypothetical protein [Puniceicoccales bacterium]